MLWLAGSCISKALQGLAAAYNGHGHLLPPPSYQRIASPAQLVQAAEAIGEQAPEALLNPAYSQPIAKVLSSTFRTPTTSPTCFSCASALAYGLCTLQEKRNAIRAVFNEVGHQEAMDHFWFTVNNAPPAQLPDLDRVVILCLAKVRWGLCLQLPLAACRLCVLHASDKG